MVRGYSIKYIFDKRVYFKISKKNFCYISRQNSLKYKNNIKIQGIVFRLFFIC